MIAARTIVALAISAMVLGVLLSIGHHRAEAAPSLQLPWQSGLSHRMNGIGHGYNCFTHDRLTQTSSYNADYWALDFEFALDEPVSAVAAGTVVFAINAQDGYGNKVVIDHGGGFSSIYAHLDYFPPGVQQGVYVSQGQIVGYADNTGVSFGDHLHFHMQSGTSAWKPEPLSGVRGFSAYGDCAGAASPYWVSRHPTDVQKVTDSTGNGKDDAVVFRQSSGQWSLAPSTGSSFGTGVEWIFGHGIGSNRQLAADVNADGKTDSVIWQASTGAWWVSISSGSGYQTPTQWITGHGVGSHNQFLADVNADGKADAVIFHWPSGNWWVAKANTSGTGFNTPTQWISGHGAGSTDQLLADTTGDLKADAVVFFDTMGAPYGNGSWFVAKSNGTIFQAWTHWAGGHGYGSDRRFVADVDGDLDGDAVIFFGGSGQWYVARSNGSTAFTPVPPPGSYWANGHGVGSDNQMLADATGGAPRKADAIIYFGDGRWFVAPSTGNAFSPVPGPCCPWKTGFGQGS